MMARVSAFGFISLFSLLRQEAFLRRQFSNVSQFSVLLYIFFKIYRILALTLKGKLDTPTTLEIPDPMSTLGLQDNI